MENLLDKSFWKIFPMCGGRPVGHHTLEICSKGILSKKIFQKSSAICVLIGLPVWFFTRKNRSLNNKDGFAIVTLAWLLVALAGAQPFYLTGAIPNFTDAWFESMSGVTTTGATIIGNFETE